MCHHSVICLCVHIPETNKMVPYKNENPYKMNITNSHSKKLQFIIRIKIVYNHTYVYVQTKHNHNTYIYMCMWIYKHALVYE